MKINKSLYILILSSIIFYLYDQYAPHRQIQKLQKHEPGYYSTFKNIFNETEYQSIRDFLYDQTFEMNLRVDATKENLLGSRPIGKDGKCEHPFLHASKDMTRCVVPAKVDTGKHMVMTGGWGGKKEQYDQVIGRVRFFQKVWLDFKDDQGNIVMPYILDKLKTQEYKEEATKVCRDKKYILPYQVSTIVALPGQEVAMHYDFAKFLGADRERYPMWLLIAMRQSNLFNDQLINQVQGVTYAHSWNNHEHYGGGFYFYPEGASGQKILIEAEPNRALIIDGSELIHGTQTFIPGSPPEKMNKDTDYTIKFNRDLQKWEVREKISNKLHGIYEDDQIRISLIWREQCFDDEEMYQKYLNKSVNLEQDYIINTLLESLLKNGKINAIPKDELEQVLLIINHYIKFPYPEESYIPYNYCALGKILPISQPLIDLIC